MAKLINGGLRTRAYRGGTTLGDKRYGAPGGSPGGVIGVCTNDVAERLAQEAAITVAKARQLMAAFGRAAQALLMRGEAVGLPHVGVLSIRESMIHVQVEGLARHAKPLGGHVALRPGDQKVLRHRRVALHQPVALRRLFSDCIVYKGPLRTQIERARRSSRLRFRRRSDGSIIR